MFSTVAAILIAIALVLPGFLIADLAETRRARRLARSDWELVLRALTYALILQAAVAATGWTERVLRDTGWDHKLLASAANGHRWTDHLPEVSLFAVGALLILPTVAGLLLSAVLRRAEQRGRLNVIHYALGGRDARDAWDYIFERFGKGFVILQLKPGVPARSPFLVGKFGEHSWAAQTPTESRDLYFEAVWPADSTGQILAEYEHPRGLWLHADQIDTLSFVDPPSTVSTTWLSDVGLRVRNITRGVGQFARRPAGAASGAVRAIATRDRIVRARRKIARTLDPDR